MKVLALATVLLALAGCEAFRRDLPPWARPVPAAASPEVSVPAEHPASATSVEPLPEPAPVAPSAPVALPPSVPAPTPAPAPRAPTRPVLPQPQPQPPPPSAPPPVPVAPAPPPASPSPPLTASLPPAEARRLQDEAQRAIEETERLLLRQLDGRPMAPKDLETYRLAQGLVEQAKKALGGQEYERAANLAAKARTLADDLSTRR